MSKDIEWFKEEMNSMHRKRDPDRNPDEWFISKNELLEALDQLDEPEVLSREWIDGYKVLRTEMDGKGFLHQEYYIHVDDLQNLIVPKQEEVEEGRVRLIVGFDGGTESYYATDIGDALDFLTDYDARFTVSKESIIPQFVANWYESEGKRNSWWNWFYKWGRDEGSTELESEVINWMQDYNEEKFVDMFLHGYTVEERELTVKGVIEEHIELLKKQEIEVNLKPYYDLLEGLKDE